MAVVFGLIAAVAYGGSDFLAGLTTKRASALAVTAGVQATALGGALVALPFFTGRLSAGVAGWGALAGVGGTVGGLALYRGLAVARMNVVAPVSGVLAAALPVVVGLASGERPGALALAGVGVALLAIALVSLSPAAGETRGWGVAEGLAAGTGFGVVFIGLQRAGDSSGVWPLVSAQSVAVVLAVALGLAGGRRVLPQRHAIPGIVLAGGLAFAATLLYLLATRRGLLTVVAVLVSLYPAGTVILAAVVLRERSTRVQVAGMAAAAAAVTLIALG